MASLLSDQVAATRTNTHPALNNSFPSRHGDGRPTTGSTAAQSPPGHTEAMDGASMSAAASWATAVGGGVPLRAPERLLPAKETDGASAAVEYPLSVTYDESVLSITGLKYPPLPPLPPRPHPAPTPRHRLGHRVLQPPLTPQPFYKRAGNRRYRVLGRGFSCPGADDWGI